MWHCKLDETGLKILSKYIVNGLIIVSAKNCHIFENKNDIKYKDWLAENGFVDNYSAYTTYLKEQNMYENTTVFDEIRKRGYLYSHVWLDDNEPMYFIYGMTKNRDRVDCDLLEDFAKQICEQFKQECFYIQRPGETLMRVDASNLKHNYSEPSDIKLENFHTDSASIFEIHRRSSYGEVFLMPHIGKIQQKRTK